MATKFTDIYNKAIFRFSDYGLQDLHPEKRDEILKTYLLSAVSEFSHACTQNINDYDSDNGIFNEDLDNEVQEILAMGMTYHWISHKALNEELLQNLMTRKDYLTYSPANLLKEISSLRTTLGQEYRGKINEYSFRNGNLGTLKVGEA